jgi:hypothetical protein
MKLSSFAKYALAVTMGATMLAACSNNGGASLAPSGTSSGMPGSQPTKSKGNGPFQYISNFGAGSVDVFDWPKGKGAQIGTIAGISSAQGECTNVLFGTGKKTFWVASSVSAPGALDEFKVGGTTPIATLNTPTGDVPVGCAMSTTGDLVAPSLNNGHVELFKGAKGTPTVLTPPLIEAFSAGFDNKSNLYVSGNNSSSGVSFLELPKGSKSWKTLSTSNSVPGGGVQFDGRYITLHAGRAIYGYTCRGATCTLKQTVSLTGSSACGQTWIARGYVICPDDGNNDAAIYKYPAGGSAIATLTGSFTAPVGSVQVEK